LNQGGGLSEGATPFKDEKRMYAIIRTQKHSSNASIGGVEKHIDRTMDVPNANSDLAKFNQTYIGQKGELIADIDARIDRLKKEHNPRVTKASVKTIEYLMTASPEAFPTKAEGSTLKMNKSDKNRWDSFVKNSKEFLVEKHGRENIAKFTIHMDEKTPHIHAFVVPVTKDNRLSAKEFLGGKPKMRMLQTDFAKKMKPLGLIRGKESSLSEHETIQEYYARVNQGEYESKYQNRELHLDTKKFELSKPPTIGRDAWRSEEENRINEELKRLQISASNERSLFNSVKTKLNEERSTRGSLERKIKKLEARIWHLENPELSKERSEAKRKEKKILSGRGI